ncbi:MAG: hypothetical protein LBB28_06400 [Synergistaceae bacterium]|jgi:hypothetical protein|nr:hypothetical protein [Synergistaceae bacterium]
MTILLDGVELSIDEETIKESKEAVYEAARKKALLGNRVIVNITVDGVRIEDEDAFFALSGGRDVQFISQPIIDLVRESVAEGRRYIPVLIKGLEGIATMIEENNETGARNAFSQAIDGINWLVGVFSKSCALLGITSSGLASGDWDKDSKDLNGALEEMVSVMESGRTMRMAYIMRERLSPAIEKFASYWSDIESQLDRPLQ